MKTQPRPIPAQAPGIEVKPSTIDGKGTFATIPFKKGRKIAEFVGEKISRVETAKRLRGKRRIRICGLDTYWAIDGSVGGNGTQFINHSCAPNCSLRQVRGHLIFFALKDIAPGDEILLDYEESYHDDNKKCQCGAPNCRGRINK
ncbi:MAG TPA: SET domain-containing protein-lysine N-methyltransferase [Blastocatellia bacterium]